MTPFEQPQAEGEKLNQIDALIKALEDNPEFTLADYQNLETQLNETQQGIKPEKLKPFEDRMQALWEKVKDQQK